MGDQSKRKSRGCFGACCIILLVLAVIVVAVLGIGYYIITKDIHHYTADKGEKIAVEDPGKQEYAAIVKKMDDFKRLPPGSNATLTITAHDLNVLIARSQEWHLLPGKLRVTIANGQVGLIGSIPLSSLPRLRDQYWNGALYFVPTIESKVFHATIQNVTSHVRDLPKEYLPIVIASLEPNINNRLLGDPVIGAVLIRSETLKIEGDTLLLTSAR